MLRGVEQRAVTGSGEDPRVSELRTAVSRLRRELAGHPAEFPDRAVAEDELASPFPPMLFMGEEWGASTPWQFFTDHTDPELA
ncbi:DUF5955 family protein, partial [Streptomyces hundungensis]|uniref:DUF5955 family protein n=1 Tax=Streptomyces hundungensis TaxID=1077946 RepID=UPI0033F90215